MKRKISIVLALSLLASLFVLPLRTLGAPSATIDPSTLPRIPGFPRDDTVHNMYVDGWMNPTGQAGTQYTVTFTGLTDNVNNKMIVSIGDIQSVSYSPDGSTITLVIKSIGLYDSQGSGPPAEGLIAAVGSGSGPGGGPPDQAKGMYMSTNANDWDIIPSDMDQYGKPRNFKIRVTGRTGISGFFKWYWPPALMNLMGVTAETLAGYIDGDQVSMNTQPVAGGGALITIRLTYSTHTVQTAKALPLSLATNKKTVSKKAKNKKVKLFGWVSPKKNRQKVIIYRKVQGQKRYSRLGIVRTNSKGYFNRTIPVKKKTWFKATTKVGRRTITSPVKVVTVR